MGLFRKKEVDDSVEQGLRRDLADEISDLQNQVRQQNKSLQESASQLDTVRSEYDVIVSNLMKIKKEINAQRQERTRLEQINTGLREEIAKSKDILRDNNKNLESAKTVANDLAQITAKLERAKKEYKEVKGGLARTQADSAKSVHKKQDDGTAISESKDILQYKERLTTLESERENLQSQIQDNHKMVGKLQEQLALAQIRSRKPVPKQDPDKNVVKAASEMVLSARKRMLDAKNELKKEKSLHDATKKELEKYKKMSSQNP